MKRSEKKLQPKKANKINTKKFFIVVEGEKDEVNYFKFFEQRDGFLSRDVEIRVIPPKDGNTPDKIFKNAKDELKETTCKTKGKDNPDIVWLVCDVDDQKDTLIKISEKIKRENFNIAVSNPCFEVWLYLHYADIKFEKNKIIFCGDENYGGNIEECEESCLISNNENDDKTKFGMKQIYKSLKDYNKLVQKKEKEQVESAIRRAKVLYEFAKDKELLLDKKGTTSVFKLIEKINEFKINNLLIESDVE